MTEKSPNARKIMYLAFAGTLVYLVWCVIIGMGVALYEASPSADAPRSRATFNQCMRQIVMLSDETTHALNAAQAGGSSVWTKWEAESWEPRLAAIKRGCNQLGDVGMEAAMHSLTQKYETAKKSAVTFDKPQGEPLPESIREMTRKAVSE
jgi:hypothetical protein